MANNADKIRDINSVGWDGIDANVHQLRINDIDAQRKLDIAYRKCFLTAEGREVLEHLTLGTYSFIHSLSLPPFTNHISKTVNILYTVS